MHLKKLLMSIALVAAAAIWAHGGERILIWPEGKMPMVQDHQIAAMTDEAGKKDFKKDEHRVAYIEWFDPPAEQVKNGACIIMISGGSYQNCCDIGFVRNNAKKLTEMGATVVNFVYRTPRPQGAPIYKSAWIDGQRAVRMVRKEAAKRGFDPERIGVMSMSAGSHLATLLATSSQTPAYEPVDELDKTVPCHINWACAFAIAYGVDDNTGGCNTRDGDAIDVKLDKAFKFDKKTCPMWMGHGGNDPYSPGSSTAVYRQLRRMKIPAELHLYPDRGHGVHGFDRAVEFMRQMGYFGKLDPEVELMKRYASDDDRAECIRMPVWGEGRKPPSFQQKQNLPYIEWHIPKTLTTKAIQIIYSGGAYVGNSPDGFEVAPARRYLNAKGMTVVTLCYRSPRPEGLAKHTTAWQDLQRTIKLVRSEAEKRGLDPNRIGIMGSSAGGHLTLMGCTSSKRRAYWPTDSIDWKNSCEVQWGIAIYPAYALTDGLDQPNKEGGNEDNSRLAREFSFDLKTPPMLFIHGDADGWAAMNSVKCWEQLRRMGIQGQLHTLAKRYHCFQSKAAPGTGSYTWLDRIWEFMSHKGYNK